MACNASRRSNSNYLKCHLKNVRNLTNLTKVESQLNYIRLLNQFSTCFTFISMQFPFNFPCSIQLCFNFIVHRALIIMCILPWTWTHTYKHVVCCISRLYLWHQQRVAYVIFYWHYVYATYTLRWQWTDRGGKEKNRVENHPYAKRNVSQLSLIYIKVIIEIVISVWQKKKNVAC